VLGTDFVGGSGAFRESVINRLLVGESVEIYVMDPPLGQIDSPLDPPIVGDGGATTALASPALASSTSSAHSPIDGKDNPASGISKPKLDSGFSVAPDVERAKKHEE
jgi:hypothetical protein